MSAPPPAPPSKADLRREMRRRWQACPPGTRTAASAAIAHLLAAWLQAAPSAAILGYVPLPDEPDILPVLTAHVAGGGRVALPAGSAPDSWWCQWWDPAAPLAPGPFHTRIPSPDPSARCPPGSLDAALLPGRAFTADGRRLGRGGGVIDRLLHSPELSRAVRLGIAFPFQILYFLPCENHDERVHHLVTSTGWLPLGPLPKLRDSMPPSPESA